MRHRIVGAVAGGTESISARRNPMEKISPQWFKSLGEMFEAQLSKKSARPTPSKIGKDERLSATEEVLTFEESRVVIPMVRSNIKRSDDKFASAAISKLVASLLKATKRASGLISGKSELPFTAVPPAPAFTRKAVCVAKSPRRSDTRKDLAVQM